MAEESNTTAGKAKAATKRKTTARKSAASTTRETTARNTTAGKNTARKKTASKNTARKTTTRKTATNRTGATRKSAPRKTAADTASPDLAARARETSRRAFLAGLGFYGKAFDQVQDQFNTVQSQLESRRKKADKLYGELVKRGEKVEKKALNAIDDIDLSRLEFTSLADRKQLEARLGKARKRFSELRESVGLNRAA